MIRRRTSRPVLRAVALLCAGTALGAAAADDQSTDIGTVRATGTGQAAEPVNPPPGSAGYVAPSRPPLDAVQPTSVVGSEAIQQNGVGTMAFDSLIKYTPSVQNVEPTGGGLQQNFMETIRGFRYTQFNSTFDGLVLPGTISSYAPQTGAYFLAHTIDSISVDRGPGTASQIGYATFGGTVAATLARPADTFGVNPYGTFGSWGTHLEGVRVDSGAQPDLNGARGMIDLERADAGGYRSGTALSRNNAYARVEAPLNENTVISFVGMYNYTQSHTPYGSVISNLHRYGPAYDLNYNPSSQSYTGYNVDNYYTDFDYIGLKSAFDGWTIDNKVYTVSYQRRGISGADTGDDFSLPGATPNLTSSSRNKYYLNGQQTTLNNDVPGLSKRSSFRAWGDNLLVGKDTAYGQLRTGFWFDYNYGESSTLQIDLSRHNTPYGTTAAANSAVVSYYHAGLTTFQPFVEFAATPLPGLTVTPGIRFNYAGRTLSNAYFSSLNGASTPGSQSWTAIQPSLEVRYVIMPGLSTYAQVARGFLAPPLSTLSGVKAANSNSNLAPQTTMNYQVGTVYQQDWLSAGLDLYYIKFDNYIGSVSTATGTQYTNNGGANYKGIEVEGTVKIGHGWLLYANGSLNDANYDGSGQPVALNPRRTAAIGPIFSQDNWYFSLLAKNVGPQYLYDSSNPAVVHPYYPIKSYNDADLAASYKLVMPRFENRSLTLKLNVLNLFNDHSIIGYQAKAASTDPTTGQKYPLLFTDAGRGFFVSISAGL